MRPINGTNTIKLRDYQHDIVAAVLTAFNNGANRLLVSLPTGTGKTIVFCELVKQYGKPALILAHCDELISQAKNKLLNVHPDADIGIVKAEHNDTDHHITIASVQTITRKQRLQQLRPDIGLIITDECHHAAADTYKRIYHRYGLIKESPDPTPLPTLNEHTTAHLGVTATPIRNDERGLAPIFDEIVYEGIYTDFVKNGYLVDLHFEGIVTSLDLSLVKDTQLSAYGKDFQTDSLSAAVNTETVTSDIFDAYIKHAHNRQRTLAFCVDREHAQSLYAHLTEKGIESGYIDGETHINQRRETLKQFEAGKIKVLFNILVFTEGFDCPGIDCILIARPSLSSPLLTQMIGQGTRTAEGKTNCLFLDVAHSHRVTHRGHAGSLVDIASLFYHIDILDGGQQKAKPPPNDTDKQSPYAPGPRPSRPQQHFLGEVFSAESITEYLKHYQPRWPWERDRMTDNQKRKIRQLTREARTRGLLKDSQRILIKVTLDEFTKGQAAAIIDKLSKALPTPKQKRPPGPNTCPKCHGWKKEQYQHCYSCHYKR